MEAAAAAAVAGLANASVIPTSTPKDAQAQSQHASPAHPTQDTLKDVGLEEESGEGFEGSEVRLCCGLDDTASATGVHDESIQGESTCCCTCMGRGNLVGIVVFASCRRAMDTHCRYMRSTWSWSARWHRCLRQQAQRQQRQNAWHHTLIRPICSRSWVRLNGSQIKFPVLLAKTLTTGTVSGMSTCCR